ncbi:MAG: sensor domain-containing diguanylate cyclase [Proteobacteria bacterium]|nr:sensor domain-containing diguanylate cyclase [Pseudomonadota bacterium]MBU1686096.1 sensor domain-containing diguanylate cyclase [Pseudomonadota bacterium]
MPTTPKLSAKQQASTIAELQAKVATLSAQVNEQRAEHVRLQAILESAIHAIIVVNDQGLVVEWPGPAELLCGWTKEEIIGQSIFKIIPHRYRHMHQTYLPDVINGRRGHVFGKQIEAAILYHEDFEVPVELAVVLTRVDERCEFTIFIHNITERKEYEAQLHHISITDGMTEVFNRRGFMTLADKQLKLACRGNDDVFLLYADFDNMKWINDTHGHSAGDEALMETARILKKTFRQADLIGRVGGDEFTVLITDRKGDNSQEAVVKRLHEALEQANQGNRPFQIQLSLGTVHYDHDRPCSIADLMIQADQLMYEHKKQKKLEGVANYE